LHSNHLKDLIYPDRVLKHSKIQADRTAVDDTPHGAVGGAEEEDANKQASTKRKDPQTAWVIAVYEDGSGEEQRWKRSITSTGASEYRINNPRRHHQAVQRRP
jgi:structural maintenance of chromosome 1